jgi:hypothetical protein
MTTVNQAFRYLCQLFNFFCHVCHRRPQHATTGKASTITLWHAKTDLLQVACSEAVRCTSIGQLDPANIRWACEAMQVGTNPARQYDAHLASSCCLISSSCKSVCLSAGMLEYRRQALTELCPADEDYSFEVDGPMLDVVSPESMRRERMDPKLTPSSATPPTTMGVQVGLCLLDSAAHFLSQGPTTAGKCRCWPWDVL